MVASEYEVGAQAWAEKWGVRMSVVFTGHRKYFQDDADTRDTYLVELVRIMPGDAATRIMSFGFGASINDSKRVQESSGPCWDLAARVKANTPRYKYPNQRRVSPTMYTIVTALEKCEPGTFEEWCGEFGYDTDSRKALDTYLVCQKQAREFVAMCAGSPGMLEEAQEIQ